MKPIAVILFAFLLSSCATQPPQASDTAADTQLGADTIAATDAESTAEEFEELQRREQKRNLERIVTEQNPN